MKLKGTCAALLAALVVLVTAAPAQATTTRYCGFVNGAVWNRVSVTYYPTREAVRIYSREYYVEPMWGPDRNWRLQYVGLRGTSLEWNPAHVPAAFWHARGHVSLTFYWQYSNPFVPISGHVNCTVTI